MPQEGQSGLGIASFVVSLVAVLFIIVAFAIVARAVETLRWSMSDASTLRTVWILAGLSSLAGLGLGIAGIVQKLRKRGLAIAGTVISGLVLLVFIFAWV